MDFWSIFNFTCQFWGVGRVRNGLVAPCRFKILDSQPEKSNMGPVPSIFMIFDISRKVVEASWPGICRVLRLVVGKSHLRVFRSVPKRTTTKSYADSWWYHLEKSLLCPFRAYL